MMSRRTKKGPKTAAPTLNSNDHCYRMPFKFTGRIKKLMVTLETEKLIPEKDKIVQREEPAAHMTKVPITA